MQHLSAASLSLIGNKEEKEKKDIERETEREDILKRQIGDDVAPTSLKWSPSLLSLDENRCRTGAKPAKPTYSLALLESSMCP